MLKYQQERNHSVLPGILCAWPENCLNYELLVTKESKLCSLKRVSFIAWYFNHFVDSNTKLTYGRIALFVRWPASVQPLGSEGLKQLPIHAYGSFARKLQNWTDYFQMEKKKKNPHQIHYILRQIWFNYLNIIRRRQLLSYCYQNTVNCHSFPSGNKGRELPQHEAERIDAVIVEAKMFARSSHRDFSRDQL